MEEQIQDNSTEKWLDSVQSYSNCGLYMFYGFNR